MASLDCQVWRVTPTPGHPPRPGHPPGELVWRVYAAERTDRAPIETELALLRALADQGEHVGEPVADAAGHALFRIVPADGTTPRYAVLLRWLPGRIVAAGLRPVHLQRIGALAARLHDCAARLVASGAVRSDRPAHSPSLGAWASGERQAPRLPAALVGRVREVAAGLHAEMATWPRDAAHHGWLHGDLHPWNIVFHQGRPGAIDFSDGGWGPLVQDLAGTLQFLKHPLDIQPDRRAEYPRYRDALLEGYSAVRPLPPQGVRQLDAMILARLLNTFDWIATDWPAPDHRGWGPAFLRDLAPVLDAALRRG